MNCDLNNYDEVLNSALQQAEERMRQPISTTKDALLQRVANLQPRGMTALGPAVLSAVALATKGQTGSQVIVCTDGMANVGIGTFRHNMYHAGACDEATVVYDKIGRYAE